jgi:hypothetical protein
MRALRTRERVALLAALAPFALLIPVWISKSTAGGDTPWLLDGTNVLHDCLARGDLSACGARSHPDPFGLTTAIGPWPALQYIPDLTAVSLGVQAHPTRVRILVTLGVVALVLALLLSLLALRRAGQGGWFWAFALLVFAGPLLAYENVSWGEPLAAGLLLCFVAVCLLQPHPALLGLAAFTACLTKETAYPIVIALGVLALVLARRRTGAPIRRHLAWGGAGVVLAFVLATLFNVVRFGSVLNKNYLRSGFHTPGVLRKLEFAAGLLVSPNGGIFLFWTSAAVVVVAACVVPLVRCRRGDAIDVVPAVTLLAIAVVLIAGLASWWTPFGWLAWGPRLSLPWMLPLALVGVAAHGDLLGEQTGRLLARPWRLAAVGAALVALALPHIGYLWDPATPIHRFFSPTDTHCNGTYLPGSDRYYGCVREQMWYRRPMLLEAFPGLGTTGGALTAAVVFAGVFGCLLLLRDGVGYSSGGRSGSTDSTGAFPRKGTRSTDSASRCGSSSPSRDSSSSGLSSSRSRSSLTPDSFPGERPP